MRTLLSALLLFGLTACSKAQDKKPDDPPPAKPKLSIGDPAPPLTVTKWVRGEEVKGFAPGKVYVLDFWATWCGPCIQMMPHLAELQAEYKDSVTVVAVSSKDPQNSLDAVEEFVKTRGAKYEFRFAFDADRAADAAYMQAAGQDGIPCSFVVDKQGKLAFVGHPAELDDVLPKVVDGTWKGKEDIEAIAKVNEEFGLIFEKADKDPAAALIALDEFGKKHPHKAKQDQFRLGRMAFLLGSGRADEAKAAAGDLLKHFTDKKDLGGLNSVRAIWTSKDVNKERKHLDVATGAAEELIKAGPSEPGLLYAAANTFHTAGNKERATELMEKAIAAAKDDGTKEELRKRLKDMKGEK